MSTYLVERIRAQAERNPLAPAFADMFGSTTYLEIVENITKVANHLADRNVPQTGRVYLNFANPFLRFVAFAAALDYGLTPLFAAPEVIKAEFGCDFVIAGKEPFRTDLRADIVVDETVLAGKLADSLPRTFRTREDDELAYCVETSGTTGRPKLLAISYAAMQHRHGHLQLPPGARVVGTIGSQTRYGLILYERALENGGCVVSTPPYPIDFLKLVNLYGVTHMVTTPNFLETVVRQMEQRGLHAPSVRWIQMTGAMFSAQFLKRIENCFSPDLQINVGYGTSEVGGIASGRVSSQTYRRGFVGKASPRLRFITFGTRDQPGQLRIVNDPKHFSRFVSGGKITQYEGAFYDIPDLGYAEDGNLYLVGRADEAYNFSGNIKAFGDIQDAIERLAPVRDVGIVSGAPLGDERDLIIALVADAPLDLDAIAAALANDLNIPAAKRFFKLYQTDAIKRNAMGKVDRRGVTDGWMNRGVIAASS